MKIQMVEEKRTTSQTLANATMMENLTKTTAAMTPFLLPQIISSIFTSAADKSQSLHKFKLLQIIHYLLSLSIFLLRLFLSLLPSLTPSSPSPYPFDSSLHPIKNQNEKEIYHEGDSGISRALSQVLFIMNDIPVTSRKYEVVRCLAEKIIDENLEDGCEVLKKVNRTALKNAFGRTLSQLEMALWEQERDRVNEISGSGSLDYGVSWVWNAVRAVKDGAMSRVNGGEFSEEMNCGRPVGWSAEKFAAELLWMAHKMVDCGNGDDAVSKWGAASNLASLALSAEPRIQGSLVKVSASLIKQAKEIKHKEDNEEQRQQQKMMLISWLPLLCRASNGTDSPVLSNLEKMELEKVVENIIDMLKKEDDQEKVLALWLHHFTSCPSSDWPNLQTCYARWCSSSRKLLAANNSTLLHSY